MPNGTDADHVDIHNKLNTIITEQAVTNTNIEYIKTEIENQKEAHSKMSTDVDNLKTWRAWVIGLGAGVVGTIGWIIQHLTGKGA